MTEMHRIGAVEIKVKVTTKNVLAYMAGVEHVVCWKMLLGTCAFII